MDSHRLYSRLPTSIFLRRLPLLSSYPFRGLGARITGRQERGFVMLDETDDLLLGVSALSHVRHLQVEGASLRLRWNVWEGQVNRAYKGLKVGTVWLTRIAPSTKICRLAA